MPPIFDQIYFCNYISCLALVAPLQCGMDIVLRANGDKIYPRYNRKYNVIFAAFHAFIIQYCFHSRIVKLTMLINVNTIVVLLQDSVIQSNILLCTTFISFLLSITLIRIPSY